MATMEANGRNVGPTQVRSTTTLQLKGVSHRTVAADKQNLGVLNTRTLASFCNCSTVAYAQWSLASLIAFVINSPRFSISGSLARRSGVSFSRARSRPSQRV
jgi:hypothetical protein